MKRIFADHAYGEAPREKCYWPSTIETPDYTAAKGEGTADIAIIGAGFTGLSAALHLAEAGADVVVLEAQTPGWGASGRNGGFCCMGGAAASDKVMALQHGEAARAEFRETEVQSVKFARGLIEKHSIKCDTHSEGETLMAHTPKAIDSLKSHSEKVEKNTGITSRFIPGKSLRPTEWARLASRSTPG